MAYTTLFVKDLTELKTRRGSPTNGVLARVLGLNFPTVEAEVLYEWIDLSTDTGDDYLIVHPTVGSTLPGRWFKRKIEELDPNVPDHVKAILTTDISNWNQKQDPISAGQGLTKTGVTLAVDNAEVVRSTRELTINNVTQSLAANRTWTVGDLLSTGSYTNPSWIVNLTSSKITGLSTVANTGSYPDLINKPSIPTTTSDLINNSGYITGFTETDPTVPSYSKSLSAFSVIKSSTDPLYKAIGYVPTSGEVTTALGFTPYNNTNPSNFINQSGARTAISLTTTGSGSATYNNSTGVINIPTPSIPNDYTNTANVTGGAGNVIFYLTSDKTSTGTALYTNVTYINPVVNDSTINYTYGWSYNSTTKALTVNVKSAAGINVALVGLTLLGVPTNVANGTSVNILVKGN